MYVIVSVIRDAKLTNILTIKNCSWVRQLFRKSVLACEDEILNTTETPLINKKVTCEKIALFTLLFISFLLLVHLVISVSCYYYY